MHSRVDMLLAGDEPVYPCIQCISLCIVGEHLRICTPGFTCCSQEMEHKLSTQSRQEFDRIMADKIGLLRNVFVSRTAKFDGKRPCFLGRARL